MTQNELPPITNDNIAILINQIATGLSTTAELVQSLSTETRDNTISLATVRIELATVTSDVKDLSRILKEGNGTRPVLTRVALLEHDIASLHNEVEDLNNGMGKVNSNLSEIKDKLNILYEKYNTSLEKQKLTVEDTKSKRQVWIAIITSVLALIAAIVGALLG
jgi:chromosome segregation ATPase